MRNKKGFTLIEILIVIALIAVVLLLLVPNVTKTFNKTKEKMFLNSVQTLYKEAKDQFTEDKANKVEELYGYYCDEQTEQESGLNCKRLNVKGDIIRYFVSLFTDTGSIYNIALQNDDYCYAQSADITDNYYYYYYSESRPEISKTMNTSDIVPKGRIMGAENYNTFCELPLKAQDGIYYWNRSGSAEPGYAPEGATTTYNTSSMSALIRSTVSNGVVTKHEACLYLNGGLYCPSIDISDMEEEAAKDRVISEMQSTLGLNNVTCITGTYYHYEEPNNYLKCHDTELMNDSYSYIQIFFGDLREIGVRDNTRRECAAGSEGYAWCYKY